MPQIERRTMRPEGTLAAMLTAACFWGASGSTGRLTVDTVGTELLDLKVTKGLGARGYPVVRLSVVDDGTAGDYAGFFDYNAPFKHRWTNLSGTGAATGARWLHSTLRNATAGSTTSFHIGQHVVNVRLPAEGAGVTGVMFGDPCTEPGFVGCIHFNSSATDPNATMKMRLPRLVNALTDVDFRAVLGDNLYDTDGGITERFYSQLNAAARAQFQPTVPGNHDFWKDGLPIAKSSHDQFGNGFVQYYGQDVIAAQENSAMPYDLSTDPDHHGALPPASDFFYYHTLGNIGFVGYSGAHTAAESDALFTQACASFNHAPLPTVIYLLGHWSVDGLGCPTGMHTQAVWARISKLPGCDRGTLRFAMGHTHCNRPVDSVGASQSPGSAPPVGYLLGGAGVRGDFMGCNTFGFAYFSTTNAREVVVGFELANPDTDRFDEMVGCFEARGVKGCLQYGVVWRNTSFSL